MFFFNKILSIIFFIIFSINALALDYYWVGGTGNWSEIIHWATTSGGAINHATVPGPDDDVYFDANSFTASGQTMTSNSGNDYCRNMTWAGVTNFPRWNGNGNMRIYGSMTLVNSTLLNMNFNGNIRFESANAGNTVITANQTLRRSVLFDGNGDWTLQDSLKILNGWSYLYIVRGTLNTNNQTLVIPMLYSIYSNNRTWNMGSSDIYVTYANQNVQEWRVRPYNFTINPGTSHIYFTANNNQEMVFQSSNNQPNLTFYDVTFQGSATFPILNSTGADLIFNNVTFVDGGGLFEGNMTFNNLNLAQGNAYDFEALQTFTFLGNLNAIGLCTAPIIIRSNINGGAVSFTKSSGSITTDYTSIRDIAATGGATFTANNAVDLGNNSGWTINTSTPRNLYWVGNGGDWAATSSWSLTSGGAPGACIPTEIDNVFFDANSFSTFGFVSSSITNPVCKDMNWTGASNNPFFSIGGILSIYGSLTLIPGMSFNISSMGALKFESTSLGNTITTAGKTIGAQVYFNGTGGGWTLMDGFTTSNYFNYNRGTLTTNNNPVILKKFFSLDTAQRVFNMGSSLITVTGNVTVSDPPDCWDVLPLNLTVNRGTSHILLTNDPVIMTHQNGGSSPIYYDVTFQSPNGVALLQSNNMDTLGFRNLTFLSHAQITRNNLMDSLFLTKGKTYEFGNGYVQVINDHLDAIGDCNNNITLLSSNAGSNTAFYSGGAGITSDYVVLKDIAASGSANFNANNAIDLGNNPGWIIISNLGRDLYWVADGGNWNDTTHWSLTSGGVGGECLPTPIDNVFFDANSFSIAGQTVTLNGGFSYCRDMDWTNVSNMPDFAGAPSEFMKIYGSLTFDANMTLSFTGETHFEAIDLGHGITSAGQQFLADVYFLGDSGEWVIQDTFDVDAAVFLERGILDFNDQYIDMQAFNSNNTNIRTLDLANSTINFKGTLVSGIYEWRVNHTNLTFNNERSNMIFASSGTGTIFFYNNGSPSQQVNFNNLSTASSIGTINTYNYTSRNLTFNRVNILSNANIYSNDSTTYDSLFFIYGKTYALQNGQTQYVKDILFIKGNNCFPINLQSTSLGNQSTIFMTSDTIRADFINMKDQNATGGAVFKAGNNSVDISNNTGWDFTPDPSSFGGFLGPDRNLCLGDSILLDAGVFGFTETYLWQNGDTLQTFLVDTQGAYYVQVFLGAGCVLIDTINISELIPFSVDLGEEDTFCAGDVFTINVSAPGASAYGTVTYVWQDNSTNSTYLADTTLDYWVDVSAGVCTVRDSLYLFFSPVATVNYTPTYLCFDDSVAGSTVFIGGGNQNTSGFYYDTLRTYYGCDSFIQESELIVVAKAKVGIFGDTSHCEFNDAADIAGASGYVTYSWSNGETGQNITVQSGAYTLIATDTNGCEANSDSFKVIVVDCSCDIKYPNAFTPNTDGLNDEFKAILLTFGCVIDKYTLQIYNRWGQEVANIVEPTAGWDGFNKGKPLDAGSFIYYLTFTIQGSTEEFTKQGTVALIR